MNEFNMLSTDPKPTLATHGSLKNLDVLTWDTGEKFQYRGTIWVQTHDASGAAHVSATSGISFAPSSYTGDLTMNGTAQAVAIVTGVRKIRIYNRGATTEGIRVAFGIDASDAQTNLGISAGAATTGYFIPAYADGGVLSEMILGVPTLATYIAVANATASDVQTVSITQGV